MLLPGLVLVDFPESMRHFGDLGNCEPDVVVILEGQFQVLDVKMCTGAPKLSLSSTIGRSSSYLGFV